MSYKVSINAATDQGFVRNENQDAILIANQLIQKEESTYAIEDITPDESATGLPIFVADGMGGLAGGKLASYSALNAIKYFKLNHDDWFSPEKVIGFINRKVKNEAMKNRNFKTGTTLSGLFLQKQQIISLHAGDSRIYKFTEHDKSLCCLTRDHNLGNDPVLARANPQLYKQKNSQLLTNFIGSENCRADSMELKKFQENDIYMICTDGLHGYIDFETIEHIIKQNFINPSVCLSRIINLALNTGGYDNISVILIKILART